MTQRVHQRCHSRTKQQASVPRGGGTHQRQDALLPHLVAVQREGDVGCFGPINVAPGAQRTRDVVRQDRNALVPQRLLRVPWTGGAGSRGSGASNRKGAELPLNNECWETAPPPKAWHQLPHIPETSGESKCDRTCRK